MLGFKAQARSLLASVLQDASSPLATKKKHCAVHSACEALELIAAIAEIRGAALGRNAGVTHR